MNLVHSTVSTVCRQVCLLEMSTELQIRGGIEDNSRQFFLFLNENICCDHSMRWF